MSKLSRETESYFEEIISIYSDRVYKSVNNTKFYNDTTKIRKDDFNNPKHKTVVNVINGDTINVSEKLIVKGLNPLVLNMASVYCPGGGWKRGTKAQEEILFYRTTYSLSLENSYGLEMKRKWKYPIPDNGAIYSPDIFVFRKDKLNKYKVMVWDECFWLNFVAVAAVRKPFLTKDNHLEKKDMNRMSQKIESIFKVGIDKGHDSLVLGAFGCGAYGNPPDDVALLFKDVIKKYNGYFKEIVFAIYDDHNTKKKHNPLGNYIIFKNLFDSKKK